MYFERFGENIWYYGDFVKIFDLKMGGLVMLGWSDGVLKLVGVRFGSVEIYNVLMRYFGGEVEDVVCVGRWRERDRDEMVCLFVVMKEGKGFDEGVRRWIGEVVRWELSVRYVLGVIEEVGGGVLKMGNGKKIEVVVK